MRLDRRLLGWGLFFILLGAIPLAVSSGTLDKGVVSEWPRLWPLVLIGWGVGLLLRRTPVHWLGGALAAVTFGIMGGGLIATGVGGFPFVATCGTGTGGTAFAPPSGTLADGQRLDLRFDCGTFTATSADGAGWSLSGTDGLGRAPAVFTNSTGVSIEPPDVRPNELRLDRAAASWALSVPRTPAIDLGFTLNAGKGTIDLGPAHPRSVSATVNAGALRLGLAGTSSLRSVNATVNAGQLTLDLPSFDGSLSLTANAGGLTVCLPADAAFRVVWHGSLAGNDLDRMGLVKVGEDTWETSSYGAAAAKLDMNVSANAGSFGLLIGGTCGS